MTSTVSAVFPELKISGTVSLNVPLSAHTTFKLGGPADIFVVPRSWQEVAQCIAFAKSRSLPYFILGGGSNLLISDAGFRGMVIQTSALRHYEIAGPELTVDAGYPVSEVSELAARNGLSGLEFIYGMPGTVGGAVWMNARCYGSEISGILCRVELLDENFQMICRDIMPGDFGYKISPFQNVSCVICRATFKLAPGNPEQILERMRANKKDRELKGHFLNPCAGSVFKNDRRFGKPTGQLIDELGLKGFSLGGARVADYHGNIIINTGTARARDVLGVMQVIETRVLAHYGFALEREVLLAGDWS